MELDGTTRVLGRPKSRPSLALWKGLHRLEIGNGNLGSYDVVWVLGAQDLVCVIASREGVTVNATVGREAWKKMLREIEHADAWALRSRADLGVDDASTYFVSLCLKGRMRQFSVYGLTLDEMAEDDTFHHRVARHRAVVHAILDVLDEVSTTETEGAPRRKQ